MSTIKKHYLIRRINGQILGPLQESALFKAFREKRFELCDEVSGHCGPWVFLDDEEDLFRHYNNLDRLLKAERRDASEQNKSSKKQIYRPYLSKTALTPPKIFHFLPQKTAHKFRFLAIFVFFFFCVFLYFK